MSKLIPSLMRPLRFKVFGVINYDGKRWTYRDEGLIPDHIVDIPGEHTDDNLVKDADGYVCLASTDPIGTILVTPILDPNGAQYIGKVYDDYFRIPKTVFIGVNF